MKLLISSAYILLIAISVCLSNKAIAQGPYTYSSPDGAQRLYQSSSSLSNQTGYKLIPSQWSHITDANLKGIEITCSIRLNLNSQIPLFTFYTDSVKTLEMFYRQNTLLIRRYKNATTYYDYQLLDPLFVNTNGPWHMKLYITSSFFWIQSSFSPGSNYLTPVYFGLNDLTDTPMQQVLTNSSKSSIVIGSKNYQQVTLDGYVTVYAFNPSELMQNIQANFSSDVPHNKKRVIPADEDIYDTQN